MVMGTGKRGRPTQPTVKRHIRGGLGCEYRIAWMLRINRLYGDDQSLSVGKKFARAFRGGSWDREVDGSQITHWEKLDQIPGYEVIRRYEELLGLPRNSLIAVADVVYHDKRGTPGSPHLKRPPDPYGIRRAGLGDVVDRALSTDAMNGDDWDALTANLDATRTVLPASDPGWPAVVERLAQELLLAEHIHWAQRNEAMVRFVGDPSSTSMVIAVCDALSADSRNQVSSELLGLLEITPHPDAMAHLIRQVSTPVNEVARRGAWWAAAEKTGRGHLRTPDLIALAKHARRLLAGYEGHPDCRSAAANVLYQLHAVTPALFKSLRLNESDASVRNVLTGGRIVAVTDASVTVNRIAEVVLGQMSSGHLSTDPILAELLGDALFDPQVTARLGALSLIRVTPYRKPTANVLAMELGGKDARSNPDLFASMVRALAFLGTPTHRQHLEKIALATDGFAPRFRATVIHSLAHCGESDSADEVWTALIVRHLMNQSNPMEKHIADGLIYALGIQRRFGSLRRLVANPAMPGPVRAAASWWLNLPEHVLRSTSR